MTPDEITLSIADITIRIQGSSKRIQRLRSGRYRDFLSCETSPDVTISVKDSFINISELSIPDEDSAFDSGTVWQLFETPDTITLVLRSPVGDSLPYRVAIFNRDLSQGEIFSIKGSGAEAEDPSQYDPLEFPLSEILMICLLSGRGLGLMVHACGISHGGRGLLFPGNSTNGKTTMAMQWKGRAVVLNDDRIILRPSSKGFLMYGTPWHGDLSDVSAEGAVLESVNFLEHGKCNDSNPVIGARAVSMLLRRSFLPLWSSSGMEFTLDLCSRLVGAVPFHQLRFVPDSSIVEFLKCRN